MRHYKEPPVIKGFDFSQKEIEKSIKNNKILQVGIGITGLCNYRCLYCFTRAGKALRDELSNKEIKSLLKEAEKIGAKTWYIAESGEPLVHEGIGDLIDYANSLGIWVIVSTNGSLLNDETMDSWFDKGVSFIIKVHSLKPETYAQLAGIEEAEFVKYDGLFMPYGLAQVLKYGYNKTAPPRAGIESVILKQNICEFPKILRIARTMGLFVHFEHLMMEGRAKGHPELSPSEKDIGLLLKQLSKIDSEGFGIKPEYTTNHFGFRKMCDVRLRYQLVIGSTGKGKVCYSNAPDLDLGMNIKKHPIKEMQMKKLEMLNRLPEGCVCNLKKRTI